GLPADRSPAGIKVWEVRTGKEAAHLDGAFAPIVFGPAGRLLLARGSDGRLLVWEAVPDRKAAVLKGAALPAIFTPDNKILTGSDKEAALKVWDAAGKELASLTGHTGPVATLACSPDGKTAASMSNDDRSVRLWDLTGKGSALHVVENRSILGGSLAFTADGKSLFLRSPSGYGGTLLDVPSATKRPGGRRTGGYPVALSADRKLLALGPRPTLHVKATVTGKDRLVMTTTEQDYYGLYSFTADGKGLILHSQTGVKVWDLDSGEEAAGYHFAAGGAVLSRSGKA